MKPKSAKVFFVVIATLIVIYLSATFTDVKPNLLEIKGISDYSEDVEGSYNRTFLNNEKRESDCHFSELTGTFAQPLIAGQAGLLVDINSGKILYEKNSKEKMKIASLTKIMTAVIALEHKKLDSKFYITRNAAYVGENTMYLTAGEVYTLEELLYGLILNSGNDAAYAIAEGVAETEKTFVEWMNIEARELGLENTYFADPSGLDDATYSTAEDLLKLAVYAMKNPDFKRIVGTFEKELVSDTHKYVYLENQTNLLRSYPGVAGIKTGYTEEAGLCLVTYAANDGREVIGVVLNSIDRKGDMILMLDHGFNTLGISITHNLLN